MKKTKESVYAASISNDSSRDSQGGDFPTELQEEASKVRTKSSLLEMNRKQECNA